MILSFSPDVTNLQYLRFLWVVDLHFTGLDRSMLKRNLLAEAAKETSLICVVCPLAGGNSIETSIMVPSSMPKFLSQFQLTTENLADTGKIWFQNIRNYVRHR